MRFLHGDVEWWVDWFLNVHERGREREISNHKFQPSVHHKQEVASIVYWKWFILHLYHNHEV